MVIVMMKIIMLLASLMVETVATIARMDGTIIARYLLFSKTGDNSLIKLSYLITLFLISGKRFS